MKRRQFMQLGCSSVLGLPILASAARPSAESERPKRLVCIGLDLSLRPESCFPIEKGETNELSPLLSPLQRWRDRLTVFSNVEHPGVSGGHAAVHAFLSGVRREQRDGFSDGCISLDQLAAASLGQLTRFPSICFGVGGGDSISWTRSGVSLTKLENPTDAFNSLFTARSMKERAETRIRSRENREIASLILGQAARVSSSIDRWDREKLNEYAESVHQFEQNTRATEKWIDSPVPTTDAPPPGWNPEGCIDKLRATLDVMSLALQSDSTRIMTLNIGVGLPVAGRIKGVDRSYHDLSHSGQDSNKLSQLFRVEAAIVSELDHFLGRLAAAKDVGGTSLLDNTVVLFGSGMGNASSHSNHRLPILIAGGNLRHRRQVNLTQADTQPTPLCNLYVTLLQQLGVECDSFATSDGSFGELLS